MTPDTFDVGRLNQRILSTITNYSIEANKAPSSHPGKAPSAYVFVLLCGARHLVERLKWPFYRSRQLPSYRSYGRKMSIKISASQLIGF